MTEGYEVQKAPYHPLFGYVSPHLPLGSPEPEEITEDDSGDIHEFSEVEEVVHEKPKHPRHKKDDEEIEAE